MKLIITADWHLRDDRPRCRIDEDWYETQFQVLNFIFNKAEKKKAEIFVIGDIFHRPTVSNCLVNQLFRFIGEGEVIVNILAGNHDLPYHSIKNIEKSSYGNLIFSNSRYIYELNQSVRAKDFNNDWAYVDGTNKQIRCLHEYVVKSKKEALPGIQDYTVAKDLLKQYPETKWFFTGDNHHHFMYQESGKCLINPGCIIRQTADLKDYKPVIYYVDTKRDDIEVIEIPDQYELVEDSYLQKEEERNERIEAFVESLQADGSLNLSFVDNLRENLKTNKVDSGVQRVIENLIEEVC